MKKREILKGIFFLAGAMMLAAACNKGDDGPTLDFNITVPATWGYYVLNSDNIVYYAVSPLESVNDSIQENIIVTKDAVTGQTLNAFCQEVISAIDNDTSFHIVYFSPVDTTINGEASRKLINLQNLIAVEPQLNDTIYIPAKRVSYFFIKNSFGYVITMTALANTYPIYKPIFDDVITSFNFKSSQ